VAPLKNSGRKVAAGGRKISSRKGVAGGRKISSRKGAAGGRKISSRKGVAGGRKISSRKGAAGGRKISGRKVAAGGRKISGRKVAAGGSQNWKNDLGVPLRVGLSVASPRLFYVENIFVLSCGLFTSIPHAKKLNLHFRKKTTLYDCRCRFFPAAPYLVNRSL
jgi:hypothetical protein